MDARPFIHAAKPWAASAAVGLIWTLAFAPFDQAWAAWLTPALLLVCSRATTARRRFALAFVSGAAHYLTSLSWVLNIPYPPGAIVGWFALSLYCALYPAMWAWFCWRQFPGDAAEGLGPAWRVLPCGARTLWMATCALSWVVLEWMRGFLITGFPWNFLGASQLDVPWLPLFAAYAGVTGVSLVVAFVSVGVLAAVRAPGLRPALLEMVLPLLILALALAAGRTRGQQATQAQSGSGTLRAATLRVALVQPSIPQTVIWDSARDANRTMERWETLLALTEQALDSQPHLLVWPEASVPPMPDDEALRKRWGEVGRRCESLGVWRVLGTDEAVEDAQGRRFYNSCVLISPEGRIVETYRKQHLVMFGEYVPFGNVFPFLKRLAPVGTFSRGEGPQVFNIGRARLAPLICFEDVVAPLVGRAANRSVDALLNLTNDGWFGESGQQWQHARNAAFRAIETGRPLIRCTNNGVSCWVDAEGRVHWLDGRARVHDPGVRLADIPLAAAAAGAPTWYAKVGDWPGWLSLVLCGVAVVRRRGGVRAQELTRHPPQAGT